MKHLFAPLVCLVTAAYLLGGCASAPPQPSEPGTGPRTQDTRQPGVSPAVSAPAPATVEAIDPLQAAQQFLEAAETSIEPERQDLQLKAATALIRAGKLRQAKELLETIDVVGLADIYRARYQVLRSVVALHEYRPKYALSMIMPLFSLQGLGPEVQADIYQLRAQANLMLRRRLDSVLDLIARESFLSAPERIQRNRNRIWQVLGSMNRFELEQARFRSTDNLVNGWLDLALLRLDFGADPFVFSQALAQWRQGYPDHSAQDFVTRQLLGQADSALPQQPQRIALLLPLASRFGRAAQAVHDGFMAAHNANGDPGKPAVAAYDVGDEPSLAPVYYRLAVKEGADFVVGPLGKLAVNALTESGAVQVPTLLLGSTDSAAAATAPVYQFDLAPEQEAQQAAQRAYLDGHRIAAVLFPKSDWGQRMVNAFTQEWESLGGVIAETQSYNEHTSDFSGPIKALLNVNDSELRKLTLASRLGTKLDFEPRRRQDLDCLFLAAQVRNARLIKPQINFFQGHDIPVYSTSHIYTGKQDPVNDADLNGIVFGDMPWLLNDQGRIPALRERIQKDWPDRHSPLDRLYALGMDAYAIIFNLPRLREDPNARLPGATASLALQGDSRIARYLTWARFEDGVPVVKDVIVDEKGLESVGLEQAVPGAATPSAARTLGGSQN